MTDPDRDANSSKNSIERLFEELNPFRPEVLEESRQAGEKRRAELAGSDEDPDEGSGEGE